LNLTEDDNPPFGTVYFDLLVLLRVREQSSVCGIGEYYWGAPVAGFAMLTKWFSFTRLETRTKESNIYASIWVTNPDA
jgi:hypothetical protein